MKEGFFRLASRTARDARAHTHGLFPRRRVVGGSIQRHPSDSARRKYLLHAYYQAKFCFYRRGDIGISSTLHLTSPIIPHTYHSAILRCLADLRERTPSSPARPGRCSTATECVMQYTVANHRLLLLEASVFRPQFSSPLKGPRFS